MTCMFCCLPSPNVCFIHRSRRLNVSEHRFQQRCDWVYSHYYYDWVRQCRYMYVYSLLFLTVFRSASLWCIAPIYGSAMNGLVTSNKEYFDWYKIHNTKWKCPYYSHYLSHSHIQYSSTGNNYVSLCSSNPIVCSLLLPLSLICRPTSVCTSNTIIVNDTLISCCDGFTTRPPEDRSHQQYYYEQYYTPIQTQPVGCPVGECLPMRRSMKLCVHWVMHVDIVHVDHALDMWTMHLTCV